jgi:hypothetical protein
MAGSDARNRLVLERSEIKFGRMVKSGSVSWSTSQLSLGLRNVAGAEWMSLFSSWALTLGKKHAGSFLAMSMNGLLDEYAVTEKTP